MDQQLSECRMYFPQYRKGREGVELFEGTILEHARKLGVAISVECDDGTCGSCLVRIERGAEALAPQTEAEKSFDLHEDERLACQAAVVRPADIYVYVVSAGEYTILSDAVSHKLEIAPAVTRKDDRVIWTGDDRERDLGPYKDHIYGMAIDVGTTTLVCQVLDLETGEPLATIARKNPQSAYGDDVISRIDYTMRHDNGLQELQDTVISSVNEILEAFQRDDTIDPQQIYEIVIVGNPTMRNMFFGLDVRELGIIPFDCGDKAAVNIPAQKLGLQIYPDANVYGPALIGGHAGADCLADIIAARMHKAEKPCMIIDIGTNGEVAVGNSERIMTASCAAGGAYEGAAVGSGVGAISGAISTVSIRGGEVDYETIDDAPALGLCGSGLIDLLAELLHSGIMTSKAKLKDDFQLTDSIRITQADVYQLITAKAGLRTDQNLLIKYYGIDLDDIETIYLAGAFGNYINAQNAIDIGLLPDLPDRVSKIGNAALAGAAEMLLSKNVRRESEQLAAQIEHLTPNEQEPDFDFLVADNMYFT